MSSISGMAASIRAATESDQFDLGGQTVATITNTIKHAFSEPFPLSDMIRITFVTGAGKLGRQKYDENAAKAVTSTLRELGFEEDRGASCVNDCAGSFKLQHDTGKNLKTVVVFPKIMTILEQGVTGLSLEGESTEALLPEGSPEAMIAMSSKPVFERMVSSKCPSWSQKKGLAGLLESLKSALSEFDQQLLQGTPLSDVEQDFYDAVSLDALEGKEAFLRKAMHAQVEGGNITKMELEALIAQVSERIAKFQKEISESAEKPKKLEKLQALLEKAQQRHELLTALTPKAPHKLRMEAEIMKLLALMAPLQKMEDEAKGRLMSVKETQMMGRKNDIMEQVAELAESSRGWFEDDDAFNVRVEMTHAAFHAKQKASKKKKPTKSTTQSNSFKSMTSTKFITPGMKSGGGAWGSAKPATAKAKKSPSGVFAAMMMDSDSE
jgi:hypothetical protein